MTIRTHRRAGLMALILGALLGLCLTVSVSTPVHAQDQSRAAESSGVTVEMLACDSKVQKECSPNSGDTAWILTSMTGGMMREKNAGDTE
jgi:hypothetical protein